MGLGSSPEAEPTGHTNGLSQKKVGKGERKERTMGCLINQVYGGTVY